MGGVVDDEGRGRGEWEVVGGRKKERRGTVATSLTAAAANHQ
jgi:hypothetical protein